MPKNAVSEMKRPANSQKQARILSSTEDLLGRGGLTGTSIEAIARAAKVSKGTIYNQFGSFDALVMAVVAQAAESLNARVSAAVSADGSVRDRLYAVCHAMLAEVSQQHLLTLERVVQDLAMRNRDLAWEFYRKGPQTTVKILSEILAAPFGHEAEAMAKRLLALCRGDQQHLVSMSLRDPLSAEERARHICECVDFILSVPVSEVPATDRGPDS